MGRTAEKFSRRPPWLSGEKLRITSSPQQKSPFLLPVEIRPDAKSGIADTLCLDHLLSALASQDQIGLH